MNNKIFAQGSGGSGPSNEKNSLFSTDAFEMVLGISEGPIYGLDGETVEDQLKNLFLDDVPFISQSGLHNFEETDYVVRYEQGHSLTKEEDPINGQDPIRYLLGGTSTPHNVGMALLPQVPITRVTPSSIKGNFDSIEVRILVNQLVKITDDGYKATNALLNIHYRYVGDTNWNAVKNSGVLASTMINGKTTVGGFVKGYRIPIDQARDVEIRVMLNEDVDLDANKFVKDLVWLSYETTKTVDENNPEYHPNTAMLQMVALANGKMQRIPNITGIWKGLLCSVPSNYDPIAKTYDETTVWDGSFKVQKEWTDNPFWLAHELITNPVFGYYRVNPRVSIDRYQLYELAKDADEKVSGNSHRFTFNGVLANPMSGMELINYILGTANAQIYDDNLGQLKIVADRNTPAVTTITPEQVIESSSGVCFTYSHTDINNRPNEIVTSYIDADLNWEKTYLGPIVDEQAQIRQGVNKLEYESIGCIYPQEAYRKMYFKLISAQTETTTVSFILPQTMAYLELFEIINIVDPDQNWGISGRALSVVGERVGLRDPIYFEELGLHELHIQTKEDNVEVYYFTVTSIGFTQEIILQEAVTHALPKFPAFSVQRTGSAPGIAKPFRIISIGEPEPNSGGIPITAIEINRNKWSASDNLTLADLPQYNFEGPPKGEAPKNIHVAKVEVSPKKGENLRSLWLTWDRPEKLYLGAYYEVICIRNGVNLGVVGQTSSNVIEIPDIIFGDYQFEICMVYNGERIFAPIFSWERARFSLLVGEYDKDKLLTTLKGTFIGGDLSVETTAHYKYGDQFNHETLDLLGSKELEGCTFTFINTFVSGVTDNESDGRTLEQLYPQDFPLSINHPNAVLMSIDSQSGKVVFTEEQHRFLLGGSLTGFIQVECVLRDENGNESDIYVTNLKADGVPQVTSITPTSKARSISAEVGLDEVVSTPPDIEWYLMESPVQKEDDPIPSTVPTFTDAELIATSPSLEDFEDVYPSKNYLLWAKAVGPFGETEVYPPAGAFESLITIRTKDLTADDIPGLSKTVEAFLISETKPPKPLDNQGTWNNPIPEGWLEIQPETINNVWRIVRLFNFEGGVGSWSEPKLISTSEDQLNKYLGNLPQVVDIWETLMEDLGDIFGTVVDRDKTESLIRRIELTDMDIQGAKRLVSGIEHRINNLNTGMEALSRSLTIVKQDLLGNQSASNLFQLKLNNVSKALVSSITRIDHLNQAMDGSQEGVSALEIALRDIERGLAATLSDIKQLKIDVDGNTQLLNSLGGSIEDPEQGLVAAFQRLDALETTSEGQATALSDISNSVSVNGGDIAQAQLTLQSHANSLGELEARAYFGVSTLQDGKKVVSGITFSAGSESKMSILTDIFELVDNQGNVYISWDPTTKTLAIDGTVKAEKIIGDITASQYGEIGGSAQTGPGLSWGATEEEKTILEFTVTRTNQDMTLSFPSIFFNPDGTNTSLELSLWLVDDQGVESIKDRFIHVFKAGSQLLTKPLSARVEKIVVGSLEFNPKIRVKAKNRSGGTLYLPPQGVTVMISTTGSSLTPILAPIS